MIDSPRPHLFLKEGDHDTTRRDNFTRIVRGARPSVQALLGGAPGRSPPTSAVMHRSNTVTPQWGDNSPSPHTHAKMQRLTPPHPCGGQLVASSANKRGRTGQRKGPGFLGFLPGFPRR